MKHPLFTAKGRRVWLWSNARRRNHALLLAALVVVACTAGMVALRVATTAPAAPHASAGSRELMGATSLTFPTMQPLPTSTASVASPAATLTGGDEHLDAPLPDPASFAVTAVNSWLTGGPVPLPSDTPPALPGAMMAGPAELVSNGDTFAAVTVHLALADGTTSAAFVLLSLSDEGAGQWSIAQLVVSV